MAAGGAAGGRWAVTLTGADVGRESVLTEVLDRLRLTPPASRAVRTHLRALEARRLKLTAESYGYLDQLGYAYGRDRLGDGLMDGGGAGPYGGGYADPYAAGGPNARKDGNNWPLVTSENDLTLMRGAARLVYDQNYLASGAVNRLADFVLGDGPTWQVTLKGSKPGPVHTGGATPADPVVRCQRVLDQWREQAQWSAGPGVGDPADPDDDAPVLHDRRREAFVRWRVDGEFFLRLFAPGWGCLPDVRWVEPELVGSDTGSSGPDSFGVRTRGGDAERVTHYLTRDPRGGADEEIPAGRVVHLKANVVATVKRGLSDFFAAGPDFDRTLALTRSVAATAKVVADIAYVRQHAVGTTEAQVTAMITAGASYDAPPRFPSLNNDRWQPVTNSQSAAVLNINAGQAFLPAPLIANIPGFGQVAQLMLRALGRKWGMDEGMISGDASNNNYASMLVAGGPFERAAKSEQRAFGMAERSLAYKVLGHACRSGLLTAADVRAVEVHLVYPAVTITNKLEDTQRLTAAVRDMGLSKQTALAELGYDPAQEAANVEDWQSRFPDPMAGPTAGLFGDEPPPDGTAPTA